MICCACESGPRDYVCGAHLLGISIDRLSQTRQHTLSRGPESDSSRCEKRREGSEPQARLDSICNNTFSSMHEITMEGYFRESHLKNAGTPILLQSNTLRKALDKKQKQPTTSFPSNKYSYLMLTILSFSGSVPGSGHVVVHTWSGSNTGS